MQIWKRKSLKFIRNIMPNVPNCIKRFDNLHIRCVSLFCCKFEIFFFTLALDSDSTSRNAAHSGCIAVYLHFHVACVWFGLYLQGGDCFRCGCKFDDWLWYGDHLLLGYNRMSTFWTIGTGDRLNNCLYIASFKCRLSHLFGLICCTQFVVNTCQAVAIWRQAQTAMWLNGWQWHCIAQFSHLSQNMPWWRPRKTLVQCHFSRKTDVVQVDGFLARMICIYLCIV